MKKSIDNMRKNVGTLKSYKNTIYKKATIGVFVAGMLTSLTILFGGMIATSNMKVQLEEQVFQTEQYKSYYEESLGKLEDMRMSNSIDGYQYINLKKDLKDVIKYLKKLPDEERAEYQKLLDKYIITGNASFFASVITGGATMAASFLLLDKELRDKEKLEKRNRSFKNDGVHLRDDVNYLD